MKINAVIFDLDGTLLDTIPDISDAMNRTLARHGKETRSEAQYTRFVGNGARKLAERAAGADTPESELEKILNEYNKDYDEHFSVRTSTFPKLAAALSELVKAGIALGVFSNKPESTVKKLISLHFPEIAFCSVHGFDGIVPTKPDPEGAIRAARELGVKPSECVFIGDSSVDILTAKNAGMRSVSVAWGYGNTDELMSAGCSALCGRPEALPEIIRKLSEELK